MQHRYVRGDICDGDLVADLVAGVGRFLQVSTDEVYGELPWRDPAEPDPDAPKFTEQAPLAPRSPYSATKAAADLLVMSYHTTHGMDVVITRRRSWGWCGTTLRLALPGR